MLLYPFIPQSLWREQLGLSQFYLRFRRLADRRSRSFMNSAILFRRKRKAPSESQIAGKYGALRAA
jgi:hypothetical protein